MMLPCSTTIFCIEEVDEDSNFIQSTIHAGQDPKVVKSRLRLSAFIGRGKEIGWLFLVK